MLVPSYENLIALLKRLLTTCWRRVGFDELGYVIVDLQKDALVLLVSLHLVRVDHFLQEFARVNALKYYFKLLLSNISHVCEVLNIELNHAVAVFNCFEQVYYFRTTGELVKQDVGVLVYCLKWVH
jgi:hypothetical protein